MLSSTLRCPGVEAINLYNIDRQAFIEKASLKHQCARDYFYGKDERLERAIRFVEDGYCASLREIMTPGFVMTDGHRQVLTNFWLLQHLRTEDVAVRTIEMANATGAVIGANEQSFRLSIREVVQIAMRTFAESMDVVSDMKLCLVRNRTATPFFASDNPAILTNRWHLQGEKTRGRSFGVPSAGCLFLLPLTPDVLCLGYDGDVYSVAHKNGWIDVRRDADVAAFNEHQFLNCHANIYVRDSSHAQAVHQAFLRSMSNRPVSRHVIHYAVEDKHDGEYTRYRVTTPSENAGDHRKALIHSQTVHAKPAEWPASFHGDTKVSGTGMTLASATFVEHESSPSATLHSGRSSQVGNNEAGVPQLPLTDRSVHRAWWLESPRRLERRLHCASPGTPRRSTSREA